MVNMRAGWKKDRKKEGSERLDLYGVLSSNTGKD